VEGYKDFRLEVLGKIFRYGRESAWLYMVHKLGGRGYEVITARRD
jgi:hypothetical protein